MGGVAAVATFAETHVTNKTSTSADKVVTFLFGLGLLAPTPGVAGTVNTLEVSGADPGTSVQFLVGLNAGLIEVPGCPGTNVEIAGPTVLGSAIADANGNAILVTVIPAAAGGQTLRFQAVNQARCQASNLVTHDFE